jgi:CRP-like cAMP-binding protein/ATP/ADP translocase/HEAT repeat protein
MTKLLEQAFDVRPEERRLVLLFFAFFAGVGMFYTVGATVGDTLFLSNLPAPEVPRLLPWVYVGIAVANVASTLAFDAIQSRASRTNSIVGVQIALAVSVLLARQLVEAESGVIYFALVIWLEMCSLLSITLFFSFAGDYFSPRDARRLYGFIAGGISLGTVLSGHAIHLSVGLIGTKNLLYIGAMLLAINAALSATIFRVGKPVAVETAYEESHAEHVSLKAIFARPYVRLLALVIPLTIVTYVTVDYQMKWIASAKSEEELARFFGSFFGWVGVAQMLFQFLLAQRLLRRLGIISCLMILPIAVGTASLLLYAGSFVGYFGLSMLALSAGVNVLRMTLAETLDLPSRELLFLPLPTRLRRRVQPLMSGAFAPGAQGLGALLLLAALLLELQVQTLSLIVAGCATALLFALSRLRPRYRETLAATLRDHQLDATDLERVLQSADAETLLRGLLRSSDPDVVKATIGLLAKRDLGTLGDELERLIDGEHDEVAVAALERLSADKDQRAMQAIQRAWSSPKLAVRQAAVLALCEAAGTDAVTQLAESLGSGDPALRTSAMIGLARYCGEPGQSLVRPGLEEQARSDSAAERVEAARTLGRISSVGFADLLERLLRDPTLEVRIAAAEACAETSDPLLIEPLLAALSNTELRAPCLRALAAMPQTAASPIAALVRDRSVASSERCAMARVLGRIGGSAASAVLWEHVDARHDLLLRLAAAESLRDQRAEGRLPPIELDHYEARIEQVCECLTLLDQALSELAPEHEFARSIFRDHARMHVELLCALLALHHDGRTIGRLQYNLFNEPAETAVQALELFEELLPRRLSVPVVRALQSWLEDRRAVGGGGLTTQTRARLIAAEPWLRVVTVHHVNQGAAYPTIEAAHLSEEDRELYRRLDVVSFLKRVPLLRDLPAHYSLEQAQIAEWQALGAGELLFRQGDRSDDLYIICQGELDVRLGDRTIATLADGECIGEIALLDGAPRSASALATRDTVLLKVGAERFRNLLITQPTAARALLRTLDRRIRETQAGKDAAVAPQTPKMRRSQLMRAQRLGLQQLVSTMSFLRQVDLFRELSTPALANLAGIAQEVVVYAGDTLFEEGDVGESLYLVCSGRIEICVNERRVAVLGRNACVGEMALISGLPRSASAFALEEGRLLRIGSDDFVNLLSVKPEIALALLRTLARRLRDSLQRNAGDEK